LLFRFQKGIDSRWNRVSKYFPVGCVLLDRKNRPSIFQAQLTKYSRYEVGCVRHCCFVSKKTSIPVGIVSLSISVQDVYSWKEKYCQNFSKSEVKNGQKFDYTNRLRRSRNVLWTCKFGTKFLKIFENFLGDNFFRIFENFFLFSDRPSHDQRPSVGIFFLSTFLPVFPIFSRTVGARCLVSQVMLLQFERRVERCWNHPSSSFRSDCVLLEGEVSAKFF